jgi:phosphoenolpyruvate-protein kinase (PTS system EI component)
MAIVKNLGKQEIAFRILDVGGDKPLSYLKFPEETNPALGQRGIRFLLQREDILRPHIRAILRASAQIKSKIICPMVSNVAEIIALKEIIEDSKKYLDRKGLSYSNDFKLGIMLEVPSAFIQLEKLIQYVDCVNIGTNDLFQYTFASDRDTNEISATPEYMDPAFISMIAKSAEIVNAVPGKEISICGEMAGDPMVAPLLIGAGINDLSMQPSKIPDVKNRVSMFSTTQCREMLEQALRAIDAEEVMSILK